MDAAQLGNTEQTTAERPSINPTLPSGDVIDAKNTLQSFDFRQSNNKANVTSGVTRYTDSNNAQASLNQPTLPSGQVIDCKNTMQSYDPSNRSSRNDPTSVTPDAVPMRTKRFTEVSSNAVAAGMSNAYHPSTNPRNVPAMAMEDVQAFAVEDVSAVAIVEGKLFTEIPRPDRTILWVVGILGIVVAIVVTGVCASGKCSTKSGNLVVTETSTPGPSFRPTPNPTLSPTKSFDLYPTLSPTKSFDLHVATVVASLINEISHLKEEIVLNGTTPESRALTWLSYYDTLFYNRSVLLTLNSKIDNVASFRIRQRYPLVTLWFHQADADGTFVKSWTDITGWLDYRDECEWYGILCSFLDLGGNVGEQNVVTVVDFYNFYTETGNNFFGTIPPDIGLLTSLTWLDFSGNAVIGTLPETLEECSLLEIFRFSDCSITGTLPSSIGKLTSMKSFDVSNNGLSGTLPPNTEQWLDLIDFRVGRNRWTGTLPTVGTWTLLRGLDLYDCDLSGTIPETLGLLTDLEYIDLGSNDLVGTLPSFLGALTNLTFVDFSLNSLAGTLPFSIGHLINLTVAIFEDNLLEGTIPISVGNWTKIEFAYFDENKFSGTVPEKNNSAPSVMVRRIFWRIAI